MQAAKENSQAYWPGVFWVGVQGLIMESVSHTQKSVHLHLAEFLRKQGGKRGIFLCPLF